VRVRKKLTRGLIFLAVFLGLLQFKNARDPLDLYFQLTREIESPAMSVDNSVIAVSSPEKGTVSLSVEPYGLVRVWKEGKYIGEIGKEKTRFNVNEGNLTLDARNATSVVVQVEWKGNTEKINLNKNIKTFVLK
jgi:hypothetical protein